MQDHPSMVASGNTPLRTRSIFPRPQCTPYGMPTVVSPVGKVVLQGTTRQTRETIRSKIEESTCQVVATTASLMQHVQQTDETISQTQQVMTIVLQKASEAAAETTQIRGDMERAIQAQLHAICGITNAQITSIVQRLSGRLSMMVTQSQSEVIQHQSAELGTLREQLERTKLEHSQTLANVQMSGKIKTDAVQTELQTLSEEIVKDKDSRLHYQKFIQEYVEQVKNE